MKGRWRLRERSEMKLWADVEDSDFDWRVSVTLGFRV